MHNEEGIHFSTNFVGKTEYSHSKEWNWPLSYTIQSNIPKMEERLKNKTPKYKSARKTLKAKASWY